MAEEGGADAEPLVEVSDITVRYGREVAVEGVSFAIRPGEIVTLIGPNGSGKTTLVRAVLGLVTPASGTVATRPDIAIGYVPQDFAVDRVLPLTVERFLALGAAGGREARREALRETGVAGIAERPLFALSGGQLRRVLLARALLRRPDLLVLDEPVQGVDLGGQRDLYRLIAALRGSRGCGVLLVSHDLHMVMQATDRVICLNRHVCCTGRPEAISRDPAYLALFGEAAGGGLALYQHRHDHEHDHAGRAVPAADGDRAPPAREEGGHG